MKIAVADRMTALIRAMGYPRARLMRLVEEVVISGLSPVQGGFRSSLSKG
jgi:hypothetical protein